MNKISKNNGVSVFKLRNKQLLLKKMQKLPKSFIRSIVGDTQQPSPTKTLKENFAKSRSSIPLTPVYSKQSNKILNPISTNIQRPSISTVDTSWITCNICLELYNSNNLDKIPRTFPYCGHSVCHDCLTKLIGNSKKGVLICHVCKKENSLINHNTANDFPCTWALLSLADEYNKNMNLENKSESTKSEQEIKCNVCKKHDVSHICRMHLTKLCAYCAFRHMKECKESMMCEITGIDEFIKNTTNHGENFKLAIANKIVIAENLKIEIIKNLENEKQEMMKMFENSKHEMSTKIDFYILQLRNMQKIVENEISEIKNRNSPRDDHAIKTRIRNTNKLSDFIEKNECSIDSEFSMNFEFNCAEYKAKCAEIMSNLPKIIIKSPYYITNSGKPYEPLFLACEKGDLIIVNYLLGVLNFDQNMRDSSGRTPFCIAVCQSKVELYKLLFEKYKCNVNIQDNAGKTPLIYACLSNDEDAVEFLVKICNADVNLQNKWKDTALHLAVEGGNLRIIKMLVENGKADLRMKNGRNKMAWEITNNEEIRKMLFVKESEEKV